MASNKIGKSLKTPPVCNRISCINKLIRLTGDLIIVFDCLVHKSRSY